MKHHSILSLLLLFLLNTAFSQQSKILIGTWYGKIPAYRFKQDSPSQCFTKDEISNYSKLLIIDSSLNYTYQEFNRLDTNKYIGQVSISDDTIKFTGQNFYLFALTKSYLIYSTFPIRNPAVKVIEADHIFEPIEVDAEYSKGKFQFLKQLYSSLLDSNAYSKDSVYLNNYEVIVFKDGSLDLSTVKELSAKSVYTKAVINGLSKLSSPFIPCKQNGRYVTARHKFVITY